ncbi:MAG TPA: glycosyltransferase family 2 protein [Burkholderiales bacterium]|nr:glycosyltransferase family 2 protein [Burkholderiales bacterium]
MALVDVVVINYNAGPWLSKVVASLHAQTFRDFRVIIVDNGSTDASLDGLPSGPTNLQIVRLGRNLGFAGGNNYAIRNLVTANWLALLNPDAFPHREWLEQFIAAANTSPQFNSFGCRMLDAKDPSHLDGVGDVYHVSGLSWREGHGCVDGSAYDSPQEIFSPCGAAALYRTKDVVDVGLFDEDYFCYSEDVDLGFRLRLAGGRCLYVPQAVVEHLGSGITGSRSDFQLYYGHRNLAWTYLKNMPGWLFWFYLPYHLLLNCYSLVAFTLRGRARPLWRAKRDAIAGLPRAWSKRREIQARRTLPPRELRRVMRRGMIRKTCRHTTNVSEAPRDSSL